MRKQLLWIVFLPLTTLAQHLGFNGAGFFENSNEEVIRYMQSWTGDFTIRVPGGAISKFHDPYNVRQGWGMTDESVQSWFARDGFDEDGNGLDKWLRKTGEQPDHSYLDDLIALQKKFPKMRVLYVLNVLNSTPEANMQAIRYLVQNGVRVTGVEAGNEIYGKYSSFDEYARDFQPIFDMLDREFPDISKGLVAGANVQRKQLQQWNDALAAYQGDYDAVILHYYYTARELGSAYDQLEKVKYTPGKYYPALDQAFQAAKLAMTKEDMIGRGIQYAKEQFPGKKIWITEWNTKPSDKLNNTLLNAGWQYEELLRHRSDVEYLLVHNGAGPDKYAMMSRRQSKYDSQPEYMIRRAAFYSFQLALEAAYSKPLERGKNTYINGGQRSQYWFSNLEKDTWEPAIVWNKDQFKDVQIHFVHAPYLYSAAGVAGYMSKGSTPSYEIDGISTMPFTGSIPAYSYGYIEWIPR